MKKIDNAAKENGRDKINYILEKHSMQQKALADITGREPFEINRIKQGGRAISPGIAESINQTFPEYSIEWLTGKNKEMNETNKSIQEIKHGENVNRAIYRIMALLGYQIIKEPAPGVFLVAFNGNTVEISAADLSALCEDCAGAVAGLVASRLSRLEK